MKYCWHFKKNNKKTLVILTWYPVGDKKYPVPVLDTAGSGYSPNLLSSFIIPTFHLLYLMAVLTSSSILLKFPFHHDLIPFSFFSHTHWIIHSTLLSCQYLSLHIKVINWCHNIFKLSLVLLLESEVRSTLSILTFRRLSTYCFTKSSSTKSSIILDLL